MFIYLEQDRTGMQLNMNRFCGVIVSVLASSAVDRRFELRSGKNQGL
jgi:hypothetical protein